MTDEFHNEPNEQSAQSDLPDWLQDMTDDAPRFAGLTFDGRPNR